ncbi:unnamed protein product [Fraxinus pennsylvanica]|uniref:Uncharacterized protein n=1 Tax=Fraxinus pennsylvanica TaxID=56036 RepID=A0AAD2DN09_9LAMI|nr:unnamed protein product [Fraxinus pennsylvanica]
MVETLTPTLSSDPGGGDGGLESFIIITIAIGSPQLSIHKTFLIALRLAFFFAVFYRQRDATTGGFFLFRRTFASHSIPKFRPVAFNLTDFGAVGDGVIINRKMLFIPSENVND